jgi:hypothetical protein
VANFETALAAAKQGKRIRHPDGMGKWLELEHIECEGGKLVHFSSQFGYLMWVPHQWEIMAETWEIE